MDEEREKIEFVNPKVNAREMKKVSSMAESKANSKSNQICICHIVISRRLHQ